MSFSATNDPATRSFVLLPEVSGGFGALTDLDTSVHPPHVRRLHLEFTGWLGDDLVEVFPCHLVTDRLAAALESDAVSGLAFEHVHVSVDPQFDEFFPETASALPSWRWLLVTGKPGAHDVWLDGQARLHATERAMRTFTRFRLDHCDVREVP